MPPKKRSNNDSSNEDSSKKMKSVDAPTESFIQRDTLNNKQLPQTDFVKIISWNVNGLRAVLRNYPNILNQLVEVARFLY